MKTTKVTEPTYTERHTMYNLFPLMARTAVVCVVPKVIDAAHDLFFKTKKRKVSVPQVTPPPLPMRKRHKAVDTTQLTKEHYDYVVMRHEQMTTFNKGKPRKDKMKIPLLVALLNLEFGLNKSATAYSNFYRHRLKREDLPSATGSIIKTQVKQINSLSELQELLNLED